MTSFDSPCEAGKLTSKANREHAPHGTISVQVLAPDGVAWTMTLGAVPAGEAPPAWMSRPPSNFTWASTGPTMKVKAPMRGRQPAPASGNSGPLG